MCVFSVGLMCITLDTERHGNTYLTFFSADDKFFLLTDGLGDFSTHRWSISRSYLLFQLEACADAQLLLAATPEEYSKVIQTYTPEGYSKVI